MVVHFQERDQYVTACGLEQYSWSRHMRHNALCNWEKVTCKNCLKKRPNTASSLTAPASSAGDEPGDSRRAAEV